MMQTVRVSTRAPFRDHSTWIIHTCALFSKLTPLGILWHCGIRAYMHMCKGTVNSRIVMVFQIWHLLQVHLACLCLKLIQSRWDPLPKDRILWRMPLQSGGLLFITQQWVWLKRLSMQWTYPKLIYTKLGYSWEGGQIGIIKGAGGCIPQVKTRWSRRNPQKNAGDYRIWRDMPTPRWRVTKKPSIAPAERIAHLISELPNTRNKLTLSPLKIR